MPGRATTADEGERTPGAGHRYLLDDRGSRIDITTTGRRSGEPRRIEIAFYRLGDDIYLSGIPGLKTRSWLANLAAQPQFTFHLKHGVVADLPATATVIVDTAERRRVLAVFVEEFNRRHGPDSQSPEAIIDEWVERSPLAQVTLAETD